MGPLQIVQLWMLIRPIRLLRNRRRAKRGLPPLEDDDVMQGEKSTVTMADGRQIEKTEPLIPVRSSTKSGTAGVLGAAILQLLQQVPWPWPWVASLTNSPAFATVVMFLIMYITARVTKTPSDGGLV